MEKKRQIGSPIFTGAVLKKLTSNGAILAESRARQMACGCLSLWGYFKLDCRADVNRVFTILRLHEKNMESTLL